MTFAYVIVVGFILFLIIANAVKMGVKEALYEFKEDIIKEFDFKKANQKNDNLNDNDNNNLNNNVNDNGSDNK